MYLKREIQERLHKSLANDRILLILGCRYSGKTTILKKIRDFLKQNNKIVSYINMENPKYLMKLEGNYDSLINLTGTRPGENVYVILDEFQNISDPLNLITHIYSKYNKTMKFIISSSFDVDEKFKQEMKDKVDTFMLDSLNFREFLLFKNRQVLIELFENPKNTILAKREFKKENFDTLKYLFEEYIKYGSYPGVVLQESEEDKIEMLEEIYTTFLTKDVEMRRIHNKPQLYSMIRILAEAVGDILNHNGLAKNLGLSITAIENYLGIIEKAFFVKKIDPYYKKMNKEIRKMPKLYFLDSGIRNLVLNNFSLIEDRIDKEGYFENIIYKTLLRNKNVKEINY